MYNPIPLLMLMFLTTATFYLGSRAQISAPLWSRYPKKLASLRDCAACSGFWDAVILALLLRLLGEPLPAYPTSAWSPLLLGLASIVWTPLLAALHQHAMLTLGTVLQDEAP